MSYLGRLTTQAACALAVLTSPLQGQRSQVLPQTSTTPNLAGGSLESELRTRLEGSGLSVEQIRSRLRSAGYPEGLLDGVLGRSGGATGTGGAELLTRPDRELMVDAIRSLGVVDSADVVRLQALVRRPGSDSLAPRWRAAVDRDSGFVLFGQSLFQDGSSLFQPNLDGPVDAGYRLGPGDRLVLILTGGVEAAHTLDITREGFVVIPQAGRVDLGRLTLGEAERLVQARLARIYQGVGTGPEATTRFSLSVARLRTVQVFVTGDVAAPGAYRISSASTVLTALYAAGGPVDDGTLRSVEVRRGGTLVGTVDVYDYLLRGDASRDLRLQHGDIVHVPVHGPRIRIAGAVTRPATYEAKTGESLADLIRAAGGLRPTAAGRRVMVERIVPIAVRRPGRDRVAVEVTLDSAGMVPPFPLADGDVVRVPLIANRVRGRIKVTGQVWHPGLQGFSDGLTLSEALRRAGGVQPDGYLPVVHIARLQADSTRLQLRSVLLDTTGATAAPVALAEDDEITVYSRTEFRPDRYVMIAGAVREGGRFPWRAGMTLRDLVLMAKGLEESAELREAEVARLLEPRSAERSAITLRVPIDSSYRLEANVPHQTVDFELKPYDNVLIRQDPGYQAPRTVTVTGEVTYPGTYVLTGRENRLTELLSRVGGLTRYADPRGAYFSRIDPEAQRDTGETVDPDSVLSAEPMDSRDAKQRRTALRKRTLREQRLRTQLLGARTLPVRTLRDPNGLDSLILGDTLSLLDERYRVGVDLEHALRDPGSVHDLLLEEGDSLHVPGRRLTVRVLGAVNFPTAQSYQGRRSLDYYIRAAGGTTERARPRAAYVIQPNGRVESRRRLLGLIPWDPIPAPGAQVVVPERQDKSAGNQLTTGITLVAQLIASMAALVALTR